jgi:hypothetical protein
MVLGAKKYGNSSLIWISDPEGKKAPDPGFATLVRSLQADSLWNFYLLESADI